MIRYTSDASLKLPLLFAPVTANPDPDHVTESETANVRATGTANGSVSAKGTDAAARRPRPPATTIANTASTPSINTRLVEDSNLERLSNKGIPS